MVAHELPGQSHNSLQCPLESMEWVDSQDRHKYYAANFAGKATMDNRKTWPSSWMFDPPTDPHMIHGYPWISCSCNVAIDIINPSQRWIVHPHFNDPQLLGAVRVTKLCTWICLLRRQVVAEYKDFVGTCADIPQSVKPRDLRDRMGVSFPLAKRCPIRLGKKSPHIRCGFPIPVDW